MAAPRTVTFTATKHGVGTTTIAAAFGIWHADHVGPAILVDAATGDLATILGMIPQHPPPDALQARTVINPGTNTGGRRPSLHLYDATNQTAADGYTDTDRATYLRRIHQANPDATIIIDAGPLGGDAWHTATNPDPAYLITTECYVALHRAAHQLDHAGRARFAGLIIVQEPGRAIEPSDCANILELPIIARSPRSAAIARTIDAGVLTSRIPAELTPALRSIAQDLNVDTEQTCNH